MKQFLDSKGLRVLKFLGEKPVYSEVDDRWFDSQENFHVNKMEAVRGLVSVIMPVYNTPDTYLKAAVDSIINQTYKNLELLIVDDGSNADCSGICDKLGEKDKVTVLHVINSGASAARNIGIEKAKGEYIAFIDSDDTMDENAIQIMVDEIEAADFAAIGCEHVTDTYDINPSVYKGKALAKKENCIRYLCYMNPPYSHIESNAIWGKLYKRELIGNLRFEETMVMAEDFKFNFDYIMRTGNGVYIDYIGYKYLERRDSISRSYKPAMMETIGIIEKMVNCYKGTCIDEPLISRCVNIAFTILMMVPDGLKEERSRIERFISSYRRKVIRNPKTKKKVKIACILSYFGYGITRIIFEINRR